MIDQSLCLPGTTLLIEAFTPSSIALERQHRFLDDVSLLAERCKEAIIVGKDGVHVNPSKSRVTGSRDEARAELFRTLGRAANLLEIDHKFVDLWRTLSYMRELFSKADWHIILFPDLPDVKAEGPAIIHIRPHHDSPLSPPD